MSVNPFVGVKIKEGRRRLGYAGKILVQKVDQSLMILAQLGQQSMTKSNNDASEHIIINSDDFEVLMTPALFHEQCHVKLNEMGFKEVEKLAFEALRKDSASNDLQNDVKSAIVIVGV